MTFYEHMNPVDRKIMILKAVLYDVRMEGMERAAQECIQEIQELEQKNTHDSARIKTFS